MQPTVTPPGGVPAFVKRMGGDRTMMGIAETMGLPITQGEVTKWKRENSMPDYIYNALKGLIQDEGLSASGKVSGFIEFFIDNRPIGKFFLAKNVTARLRKRRE